VPLFLVGPVASVLFVRGGMAGHLPANAVGVATLVALALWSPLPIALPALVMQDVRDAYAPEARGIMGTVWRGARITFALCGRHCLVRTEMIASLLGFGAALLAAAH
jgi:hypothetical protein